jgi:predicted aspartyl protease
MQKLSIVLRTLALIWLSTCAAPEEVTGASNASTDPSVQSQDTGTAALEALRVSCASKMEDASLDPIRGKIELMRDIPVGDDNGPPPVSVVMNNSTPTSEEKIAVRKWANIHDECIRQEYSVAAGWTSPELATLGRQIDQKMNNLIVALLSSKLTYSAFALKRVDITNQFLAAGELLEKGGITSQQALSRASQIFPVTIPEVTPETEAVSSAPELRNPKREVKLRGHGNTYTLPVQINGSVTVYFILDSGASDVQIPMDVFRTLVRGGTISERDLVDEQTYSLADGSEVSRSRYMFRTLEIGGNIIPNVIASIGPLASDPLLGQSFLSRLNSWTLDNKRHVLILSGNLPNTSGVSTAGHPRDP